MAVKTNVAAAPATAPVSVSLDELKAGSVPFSDLEAAFGPNSLGIIVVRDLPAHFAELRAKLLSYSSYLANLPESELEKLESPASKYLVGWSLGKETLKSGHYDTLKGSYYANPVSHPTTNARAAAQYPTLAEYNAANVWPADDVLPGFETTFQRLCDLVIETAVLVARACDRYAAANVTDYRDGYLEHVVRSSVATKARLLHYFPPAPPPTTMATSESGSESGSESAGDDDWCATHLDHGCLTGLTSAMFVDEAQHAPASADGSFAALPELDKAPDPLAGLYIHSREGLVTKVSIPRDCLAFQTGEALEVITQGRFRAVPHFVRGAAAGSGGKVARNTLAVFTQPNLWEMVDETRDFATFAKEIVERNH